MRSKTDTEAGRFKKTIRPALMIAVILAGLCLGCGSEPEMAESSVVEKVTEEEMMAIRKAAEEQLPEQPSEQTLIGQAEVAQMQPEQMPAESAEPEQIQTGTEQTQTETEQMQTGQPEQVPAEQPDQASAGSPEESQKRQTPAEQTPAEQASAEVRQEQPEQPAQPEPSAQQDQPVQQALPASGGGRVIVLDPGHTALADGEKEPIGPGAAETKLKDTVGTQGAATGIPERDLVLNICRSLRTELQNRGYTVLMTRESNDLKLSCSERAAIANAAGAAAFLRVHADGVNDGSVRGASAICITPNNPFTAATYTLSRRLSDSLLGAYCETTGFRNRGVSETDTMSGNNWSQVPTTLIELGFMTNAEEDRLMNDPDFQTKMVRGLADGIDRYFAR